MKNIALFVALLIPSIAAASVRPITAPASVDGTDIAPTKVTATYVQVSSMTATARINLNNATGVIFRAGDSPSNGVFARYLNTWAGFNIYDTEANGLAAGATGRSVYADSGVIGLGSAVPVAFSATTDGAAGKDAGLSRVSAGVIGVGTGAAGSVAGTLNAAALNISGSTFTVADTGVVSAPSQPGAQLYLPAQLSFASSADQDIFWDTTVSNRASYNRSNTVVAASSNTFTARGAGVYYASCCVRITTTGSTSVSIRSTGGTIWLRTYGKSNPSYETICAQGFLSASNNDTYSCRPTASAAFTVEGGLGESNMTFQKVW